MFKSSFFVFFLSFMKECRVRLVDIYPKIVTHNNPLFSFEVDKIPNVANYVNMDMTVVVYLLTFNSLSKNLDFKNLIYL